MRKLNISSCSFRNLGSHDLTTYHLFTTTTTKFLFRLVIHARLFSQLGSLITLPTLFRHAPHLSSIVGSTLTFAANNRAHFGTHFIEPHNIWESRNHMS